MGPSGAGKTTLLNLLADRPTLGSTGRWSGQVLLNGRPRPEHWRRSCGYCMQRDIFFEELTLREHLECSAALLLPPAWKADAKRAELERIIDLLSLRKAQHTRVGGPTSRV